MNSKTQEKLLRQLLTLTIQQKMVWGTSNPTSELLDGALEFPKETKVCSSRILTPLPFVHQSKSRFVQSHFLLTSRPPEIEGAEKITELRIVVIHTAGEYLIEEIPLATTEEADTKLIVSSLEALMQVAWPQRDWLPPAKKLQGEFAFTVSL